MDNRTQEFLTKPIVPLLIRMSAPNTLAFFIQSIVVLTEVWFISKLGTKSLAAVALAFPLLMLTQTMSGGALGGAISSAIARSMGANDIDRAEKLIWHSIVISISGAFTFLILFLLFGKVFFIYWEVEEKFLKNPICIAQFSSSEEYLYGYQEV